MPDIQIKICGLSTPETIDAAVAAGATHVGLVHFAASPRHVTVEQAVKLRRRVPQQTKVVLLLVNEQPQPMLETIQAVQPDVVQFHGSEPAQMLAVLKQHLPVEIWKAIGVSDQGVLDRSERFKGAVDRLLYDAPASKLPGGSGLTFDWQLLANHKHALPWGLAGGLTPDTVAEAIRVTGAPLVDASTGLESAPGVKDVDKIAAFCQAARGA